VIEGPAPEGIGKYKLSDVDWYWLGEILELLLVRLCMVGKHQF